MENLLFLGVPILKLIRVVSDLVAKGCNHGFFGVFGWVVCVGGGGDG